VSTDLGFSMVSLLR